MKKARLRNRFLKDKTDYNKKEYAKQRNYCISLVRKSKKPYYTVVLKKKSDNKTAQILNSFFSNIGSDLKIQEYAKTIPEDQFKDSLLIH